MCYAGRILENGFSIEDYEIIDEGTPIKVAQGFLNEESLKFLKPSKEELEKYTK